MDMESIILLLGSFGKLIYHFMFSLTSIISNLISCRNYILKGKER